MTASQDGPAARGPGYTARPAQPGDLRRARELIARVIEEDLGYAYNPAWHWDLDDLRGVYLDDPRHALWVVTDDATGELLATGAVRRGGPGLAAHPALAADRYDRDRTAQVVRVYVARPHRRRGIARTLVELARRSRRRRAATPSSACTRTGAPPGRRPSGEPCPPPWAPPRCPPGAAPPSAAPGGR